MLRNRQSVMVTGLRNRQSSLRNSAKLEDICVTVTDCLFLRPVTETDCLFLKPVTETHSLFFSTLWPDNFIKISWFKGKGGQKVYRCDRVPLRIYIWEFCQIHVLDVVGLCYAPSNSLGKVHSVALFSFTMFLEVRAFSLISQDPDSLKCGHLE